MNKLAPQNSNKEEQMAIALLDQNGQGFAVDFSLEKIQDLNNSIVDAYNGQVNLWINWMRENAVTATEEGLRAYFSYLLAETKYSASTKMLKRQAVKKRIRKLFEDRPLEEQIKLEKFLTNLDEGTYTKAPKINSEKIERNKIIQPEEYNQLLMACRTNKQRLFMRFLWITGARVNEMTGAMLQNCNPQCGVVYITVIGKDEKTRAIRIYEDFYNEIREEFKGHIYLFETSTGHAYNNDYISHQITKIGERVWPRKRDEETGKIIGRRISAHTFRHSFATRKILENPAKLSFWSKYMGHVNVSITLRMYCHVEATDEEILGEKSDKAQDPSMDYQNAI